MTIDHCPDTENHEHDPDYHGTCQCGFSAPRSEWWDYYGGPAA